MVPAGVEVTAAQLLSCTPASTPEPIRNVLINPLNYYLITSSKWLICTTHLWIAPSYGVRINS
jgi:hypothetical protein